MCIKHDLEALQAILPIGGSGKTYDSIFEMCFVCGIRPGVEGYSSTPHRMRCKECGEALCDEIERCHKKPKNNGVFGKDGPLERFLTKGDLTGLLNHFTEKKE
jgi:hypothetical protein